MLIPSSGDHPGGFIQHVINHGTVSVFLSPAGNPYLLFVHLGFRLWHRDAVGKYQPLFDQRPYLAP